MNVDNTERSGTDQDSHIAAPSFDRMRNMLVRAVEVRESEQQQVFDALDDIYARLAPVDSLGAIRKRLSELADRTEIRALGERLEEVGSTVKAQDSALVDFKREVLATIEAQETAIVALSRSVSTVLDRLDQIVARLDLEGNSDSECRPSASTEPVPSVIGDPALDLLLRRAGQEAEDEARPRPNVNTLLSNIWKTEVP